MTIDELLEILENMKDELGGDTTVRLQTQQNWPMENELAGVTTSRELEEEIDRPAVYLVEGSQRGYGNKAAWEVI